MRIRNIVNKILYPQSKPTFIVDLQEEELIDAFYQLMTAQQINIQILGKNPLFPTFDGKLVYDGCIINSRYSYAKAVPITRQLNIPIFLLQGNLAPDKKEHAYLLSKQVYHQYIAASDEAAKAWYTNTIIKNIYDPKILMEILYAFRSSRYI